MDPQEQPEHEASASQEATDERKLAGDSPSVSESPAPDATGESHAYGRLGLCVVALMVVVADMTLYKAHGFAGPAVFFVAASLLISIGLPKPSLRPDSVCIGLLVIALSWRMLMAGNHTLTVIGFWLLFALACTFRRHVPFVMDTFLFALECLPEGVAWFLKINNRLRMRVLDPVDAGRPSRSVELLLPLISVLVFGSIFVMANPDMVRWVSGRLADFATVVRDFFFQFSVGEMFFWAVVAVVTGGILRPVVSISKGSEQSAILTSEVAHAPLYAAFRNTLVTVIALFLCYLAFESRAFLSRKPPAGFTFSSYAHEGAAWLTVALALATLTLSLIFRGSLLVDPRLRGLERLAWVWSALNFVLAIAVYNRMLIYISYNGMTRMRVVALLGITSVVCGFALVVVKIYLRRRFWWLVQRQLWVLGLAIYINAVLPVDRLIHTWNVDQVLSGNHAPVVQMTAHHVDSEALPILLPLCSHEDPMIAEGISAMMVTRQPLVQQQVDRQEQFGWTAWQWHHGDTLKKLEAGRTTWDRFNDDNQSQAAWTRLREHAYATWW